MIDYQEEKDSLDIREKIRDIEKEYGHRLISLQILMIDGNFSLERGKKFAEKNIIEKNIKNEGFERNSFIDTNELKIRYGKVGYRTKYFNNLSRFIPQQIELVNEISNIRFIKIDTTKTIVYIYGGSNIFIEKNVNMALSKLASFCDCSFMTTIIPQSFIKKLCLEIHNRNVEFLKIDPSKSKNYAQLKEEIKEESDKTYKYEFIIKENALKGEHIMKADAIKKLFKEEPEIEIIQYKSAINILRNGRHKIKYELNSNGKLIFYTNNSFLKTFDNDERKTAEFLMNRLEEDAEQNILVEAATRLHTQKPLSYYLKKNRLLQMLTNHINEEEYIAASAILIDLTNFKLTKEEQDLVLKGYLNIIKKDSHTSLDLTTTILRLLSNNIIEENIILFKDILESMNMDSFLSFIEFFLNSGHQNLIQLINDIISKKTITKNELKKRWVECLKEKDKNKKGKKLEEFLVHLFCNEEDFELSKIRKRTANEEIDIELKNKNKDTFWEQMNSPFIFIEAKNWSMKVESKDVKLFKDKIISHKNLCRVGFMISVNGYTKGCDTEKIRVVGQNVVLVLIDGKDIDKLLQEDVSIKEFLEKMISLSIR